MKLMLSTLFLLVFFGAQAQTEGTVNVSVTSLSNGKDYSPNHVLAIWVEDESNAFVKTLKLRGDKRKQYLYTWNSASSGNTTDAITGATLGSHTTHSVTWDVTDTNGNIVADGNYQINIEYTSEHAQGPLTAIAFAKGTGTFTIQPNDEAYFTNMDLVFTPASTTGLSPGNEFSNMAVYPNPATNVLGVSFRLNEAQETRIGLYDSQMRHIRALQEGRLEPGNHSIQWELDKTNLVAGSYFLVINGNNQLLVRQVIIGR